MAEGGRDEMDGTGFVNLEDEARALGNELMREINGYPDEGQTLSVPQRHEGHDSNTEYRRLRLAHSLYQHAAQVDVDLAALGVELRRVTGVKEETSRHQQVMLVSGQEKQATLQTRQRRPHSSENVQSHCTVTSLSPYGNNIMYKCLDKIDPGTTVVHSSAFVASGARLASEGRYSYMWARQQTFRDEHGLPQHIINECVASGLYSQGVQLRCFKCGRAVPLTGNPTEDHGRMYPDCR